MAELPIVVLAFANEQEGRRYLRDLPEELRRLEEILKGAERNGLCRLEVLSNATLDQIFDVFTRNRDQVTILHYAGHADSGRLLLESTAAGGAAAHAAGLATFLGQRRGLQLVFLNGCSTRGQVARLLEAGVAAVIATARAIDDTMARSFAIAFYTELASGAPLRAAYESARGRVLAAHDSAPEAYYGGHRDLEPSSDDPSPDPTDDHGFPWEFRPGAELVERWSLPDAAGNPEFGLPHLPERDLPERPFRHLSWFTAEHAEVFFGRGYQVRELYEQVTDPSGPPILLLHGASGVGKSSLMDAGLVPRLEAGGHAVRYSRRDQRKGLAGSLRSALCLTDDQIPLAEGWRAVEAQLGKPLVVFLDQVEEVFTRPDAANPRELDDFLATLSDALANREARPRGKLVLGFRKEWLAEIDRRMAESNLPRAKVFLKPLDRRAIIEAIRGPTRPGRLLRQYRLTVEDGLPEVIADDLLADAGSALASTLQVLLTKMWERASAANPTDPRFDHALYESLKAEGYLLKDVLDEGLRAIGRWDPAVERSGLALDVLAYHTTDLGTASQRTRAELEERYAHQRVALGGLLDRFQDTYLLIEAESRPDSPSRSARLAHDLLAPLVLQRFRLSTAPGQRARRLLENRAPEWREGKAGAVLDGADLATVEGGASGMRARSADEDRLVEASRLDVERRKAEDEAQARRLREAEERQRQAELDKQEETERRLKDQQASNQRLRKRALAMAATLVLAIAAAVLAAYQRRVAVDEKEQLKTSETRAVEAADEAKKQAINAEASEIKAVDAAKEATRQEELAQKNLQLAIAQRLAACSRDAIAERPQQALALAVEAIRATRDDKEPVAVAAEQALHDALTAIHGRALTGHTGQVSSLALATDGRLVTGSTDGTVWMWDLNSYSAHAMAPGADVDPVNVMGFAPDGRLVAGGKSGKLRVWDAKLPAVTPLVLQGHKGAISALAFLPDGRLLTGSEDRTVRVWDLRDPAKPSIELEGQPGSVHHLAVAADGQVAVGGTGPRALVFDLTKSQAPTHSLAGHKGSIFVAFAPDRRLVTADTFNGLVHIWKVETPAPKPQSRRFRTGGTSALVIAPDGRLAIGGIDGTVRVWDRNDQSNDAIVLTGHQHRISTLAFAPDGRLVSGGQDGTVRLWDLKGTAADQDKTADHIVLRGHEGEVKDMAFVPDDRLVTCSADGTARAWDLRSPDNHPFVFRADEHKVTGLDLTSDGRLVTAGIDGTPKLWDLANPSAKPLVLDDGSKVRINALTVAADGRLATGGFDGSIRVWDVGKSTTKPHVLGGHHAIINALRFASDGRLATASMDGNARVWDASSTTDHSIALPGGGGGVLALAFAPDGRLVTGTGGGKVRVWDLRDRPRNHIELTGHKGKVSSLAFAPDGRLVTTDGDGKVRLWDLTNPAAPQLVLDSDRGAIHRLAFASDGRLAAGGHDGTTMVWDLKNSAAGPKVLRGQGSPVIAILFAPDGRLVTGAEDGRARVWDMRDASAQPLVFHGPVVGISSLIFAPDGRLVMGGLDGNVRIWNIALDAAIDRARRISGRNLTNDEWAQFLRERPYHRTFDALPDGAGVEEGHQPK